MDEFTIETSRRPENLNLQSLLPLWWVPTINIARHLLIFYLRSLSPSLSLSHACAAHIVFLRHTRTTWTGDSGDLRAV